LYTLLDEFSVYKFRFVPFRSDMPNRGSLADAGAAPPINPAPSFAGSGLNRPWQEAARLNITERQLRDWRAQGLVPFVKIGGVILFDPNKVDAALSRFERNKGAIK
jgi:hypothetical protein